MDNANDTAEVIPPTKDQLSARLAHITKKLNEVKQHMRNEDNDAVSKGMEEVDVRVTRFRNDCSKFAATVNDPDAVAKFHKWFEQRVSPINEDRAMIQAWLNQNRPTRVQRQVPPPVQAPVQPPDQQDPPGPTGQAEQDELQPIDSVSEVGSNVSQSSRTRAATMLAQLLVQKRATEEEIRLEEENAQLEASQRAVQKRLKLLKLETEIAKTTSVEKVLEQLEQGVTDVDYEAVVRASTAQLGEPEDSAPQLKRSQIGRGWEQILEQQATIIRIQGEEQRKNMEVLTTNQERSTGLLSKQHLATLLPSRGIDVFNGDVLKYKSFIRAFEHVVEDRAGNDKDRLHFLEQFTSGKPQELVRSCALMEPSKGYQRAKELLKQRFGDEFRIASEYIRKVTDWQPIKPEDGQAIDDFAIFLRGCLNAMEDVKYLSQLNSPEHIQKMMMKLPFELRKKWRNRFSQMVKEEERLLSFEDFVDFIEAEAAALNDPIFGRIAEEPKRKSLGRAMVLTTNAKEDYDDNSPVRLKCFFCSSTSHHIDSCRTFEKRPVEERKDFIRSQNLCFGCLKKGHRSKFCKRRMSCNQCQRKHPTVLHGATVEPNPKAAEQPESGTAVTNMCVMSKSSGRQTGAGQVKGGPAVSIAIVPVLIMLPGAKPLATYAAQDPCSTATFIKESLFRKLGVKAEKTQILLTTMEKKNSVTHTKLVKNLTVTDLDQNQPVRLPNVFVKQDLPVNIDDIPSRRDIELWSHLDDVQFQYLEGADVELLIGMDVPDGLKPLEVVGGREGEPYAIRTKLGWSMNGPLQRPGTKVLANRIKVDSRPIEEMFNELYDKEFGDTDHDGDKASVEDSLWSKKVEGSIKLENNHYTINLPFRKDNIKMPLNYEMAKSRLEHLARKFERNPTFKEEYVQFVQVMEEKGYIRQVPKTRLKTTEGKVWYVPHHGVRHPHKKKLRVVLDCSAKYKGVSLNDELLQGPDLANSLVGVLLRFRQYSVAFMGDIEAMYYQVRIPEDDADFLRFLWWPKGEMTKKMIEYQLMVHPFGATSSPSCANYALVRAADDFARNTEVAKTMKRSFYVDDCLKSVQSVQEAKGLINDFKTVCSSAGFKLAKFVCNEKEVLEDLPNEDCAKNVKELNLDSATYERALGVCWRVDDDKIGYQISVKPRPTTRRGILSVLSSVFDPLGLVGPVLLPGKRILQELSRLKLDWDATIPQEHEVLWNEFLSELPKLEEFSVDRCLFPNPNVKEAELHVFSDASEAGYAAAAYLRTVDHNNVKHVALVAAKTRVSPLKKVTIPRLELSAAHLAAKLEKQVRLELEGGLSTSRFWTDSTTVLKYIKNEKKRFHRFVANRVQSIRASTKPSQWFYVASRTNASDIGSRGSTISELLSCRLWTHGPWFLWQESEAWHQDEPSEELDDSDPEVKKETLVAAMVLIDPPMMKLVRAYSDWFKLRKAVAWILRLRAVLSKKTSKEQLSPLLTAEELEKAERSIISYVQSAHFQTLDAMMVKRWFQKLSPFEDDSGIIRVGGRLRKADLLDKSKHPVILPKESPVTEMILRHEHKRAGHMGVQTTLANLRESYWVVGANAMLRKLIRACVPCRKRVQKVGEQVMADLPQVRVQGDEPPFTAVGVDMFGHFEVKRGRSLVKRWGCLFTCLRTRAIHLEVVHSLDTSSFIMALRRLIARRGTIREIWSDNGTCFKGAEKELRESIEGWNQVQVNEAMLQKGVKWTFNPPYGSHHGGVWERQIRTVRQVLRSIVEEQTLNDETLLTLMAEVECIVNSIPITTVSNDVNDLRPLSPNDLLLLKTSIPYPPGVFNAKDNYARRRWRQIQYLADVFWTRWRREYLPLLQSKQKWTKPRRNFKVGDIVLLVDDSVPRCRWQLGRVVHTFEDHRGHVRKVKVKRQTPEAQRNPECFQTVEVERPIDKLCLIAEDN